MTSLEMSETLSGSGTTPAPIAEGRRPARAAHAYYCPAMPICTSVLHPSSRHCCDRPLADAGGAS